MAGMLSEGLGTCSLKHLSLAEVLAKEWPTSRPQIVHRVYRISPSEARRPYGVHAASFVPDDGIVDVHRYLLLTLNSKTLIIDATLPGPAWDGEHSMQLACGDGRDTLSHGDADMKNSNSNVNIAFRRCVNPSSPPCRRKGRISSLHREWPSKSRPSRSSRHLVVWPGTSLRQLPPEPRSHRYAPHPWRYRC